MRRLGRTAGSRLANGLEQPDGAGGGDVEGVLGDLEGDPDVALGAQVIDLVGLQLV
jgi:hypothetical protein